jgi:hypothetical protein
MGKTFHATKPVSAALAAAAGAGMSLDQLGDSGDARADIQSDVLAGRSNGPAPAQTTAPAPASADPAAPAPQPSPAPLVADSPSAPVAGAAVQPAAAPELRPSLDTGGSNAGEVGGDVQRDRGYREYRHRQTWPVARVYDNRALNKLGSPIDAEMRSLLKLCKDETRTSEAMIIEFALRRFFDRSFEDVVSELASSGGKLRRNLTSHDAGQ